MAKKGPAPKPDRQRRNNVTELVVVRGQGLEAPAGRPKWLKAQKDSWAAFWDDLPSQAVTPSSLPALYRLWDLRDMAARLMNSIEKVGSFIEGSQNQTVANPAYRILTSLLGEIRQLEDRFAANPEAALKLGLKAREARRTLEDLNRESQGPVEIAD